jgi:hypothetical protein
MLFVDFEETDYVLSILDMLAAATSTPEIAPPRHAPTLRGALYAHGQPFEVTNSAITTFEQGGYTVIREVTAEHEHLLAFDHGPLGYLSIAAHGHADALGIWLHIDGEPVLVDAGTYLYHAGREWRSHFRGTPAHNTLSINGEDSSIISGPFNWSHKAKAHLTSRSSNPDAWAFSASHNGWESRFDCVHQRMLKKTTAGFVVEDRLTSPETGPWAVEIGFLFAPNLTIQQEPHGWRVLNAAGKTLLILASQGDLTGHLEKGLEKPLRGWYSPAFGLKETTTRLAFRGSLRQNVSHVFNFQFG